MPENFRSVRFWIAVALSPLAVPLAWQVVDAIALHRWDNSVWTKGYFWASAPLQYVATFLFGWPIFIVLSFMRRLDGVRIMAIAAGLGGFLGYGLALFGDFSLILTDIALVMGSCLVPAVVFWLVAGLPWRIRMVDAPGGGRPIEPTP